MLRKSTYILAVVATTLVAAILFWFVMPDSLLDAQGTDFLGFYQPVAQNLVAGNGITLDGTELAMKFPPGHPFFIAVFFEAAALLNLSSGISLALLSITGAVASSILVFEIAASIWNPKGAFIATLAWIVYPFALQLFAVGIDGRPLSEVTFIPIFLASVLVVQKINTNKSKRKRDFVMAGLLVGFATLIRPFAFGLIVVFLIVILAYSGRHAPRSVLIGGLLMLGTYAMVLLPWEVAIYRNIGEFIWLSTVAEGNASSGLVSFAIIDKEYRQAAQVPDDVMVLMEQYVSRNDEMTSISAIVRIVAEETAHAPLATAKLFGIKALRSWYATDSGRMESLTKAVQLLYLIPIIGGMFYIIRFYRTARSLLVLIVTVVLYFWVLNITVLPVLRYMLPIMPLLIIFIPGTLVLIQRWIPSLRECDSFVRTVHT